jgi:hypothetical protein
MSDQSEPTVAVGTSGDVPMPPPPVAPTPPPLVAPTPPPLAAPAPPPSNYAAPPRKRSARVVSGLAGAVLVIGLKLLALTGVTHLLRGASPAVIIVVLVLVSFLSRRVLRRFFGR